MSPKGWLESPARVTVVLLGGTALSVAAVLWMGLRLIEQDLALERQQAKQRLEATADAAAALLDRALLQTAQAMSSDQWQPAGNNVVLARAKRGVIVTVPQGALLFSPVPSRLASPDSSLFAAAEREEFAHNDWVKAAAGYRGMLTSQDPGIRTAALVRIARVQAKSGHLAAAIDTYSQIARLGNGSFDAVPTRLVAHLACSTLLRQMNQSQESRAEAAQLGEALDHPRQLPSRDVFLFHAERAEVLSQGFWKRDPHRFAISEAVSGAWPKEDGSGRLFLSQDPHPATVLWFRGGDTVTVLAAGMEFARKEWTSKTNSLVRQAGAHLEIGGAAEAGEIVRPPSVTGLPWSISLREAQGQDRPFLAGRRRLLATGALAFSGMLLLAGYLAWRAVSRELAAARMQADFVAAVSHEFRTPLTALRQFTGMLLERDTLSDAQRRTCYEAQERSTERLSRLVESLLDFRRMEAGARPYTLERIDAASFVSKVAGEFARESGADLRLDVPPECPVLADAGALSLALWNLLDNAVKYSQAAAPVEVRVHAGVGWVRVSVTDHGAGIPLAEQGRIFDRFVRGGEARQLGVKGTGIGLAMVRHVAQAHKGRVELESRAGKGSTFTIVLPAAEP